MKTTLGLLFSFLLLLSAEAQTPERFGTSPGSISTRAEEAETEESSDKFSDRLVYGGNFTLSFGSATFIHLAPSVGYKFNEKLMAGPGFIYQYIKFNRYYDTYQGKFVDINFETSVYGPKAFINYFPWEKIYVGSQFEYLNHRAPQFSSQGVEFVKTWTSVLFLEGGYSERIGSKGRMLLGVRYNVLHDYQSPYGMAWYPVVSIFF